MTPFFSLVSAIARLIRYYVATSTSPEWSGLASVPTFPARGERDSDPGTMLADKGYDSDAIRQDLRDSGATPKIPTRSNRKVQYAISKSLYALRSRIEFFIGHLKEQRRIGTRYDKLATSFLGFVLLGCLRIWARFVHRA